MGKNDPKKFVVKGKPLCCPVCGYDKFWQDNARIERGFGEIGASREATTLTCEESQHILWFET